MTLLIASRWLATHSNAMRAVTLQAVYVNASPVEYGSHCARMMRGEAEDAGVL